MSALAHGQSPTSLVIDSTSVYWGNRTAQTVVFASKRGGPVITLATAPSPPVVDAVDSTTVVWHTKSAILSTPRSGGTSTTLDSGDVGAVAACPPLVLWSGSTWVHRDGGPWVAPPSWNLPQPDPPTTDAVPARVAEVSPYVMVLHGSFLLWSNAAGIGRENRLVRSGTSQFVIAERAAVIVPVANVTALTTDSAFVYARAGHTIVKAPLGGGAPITLATQQERGTSIATDGVNVYWTNPEAGTVNAVSTYGGTIVTLVSGQSSPQNLAVDEDSVYLTAGDSVIKVTPK